MRRKERGRRSCRSFLGHLAGIVRSGAIRLNSAGLIPVSEIDRLIEAKADALVTKQAVTAGVTEKGRVTERQPRN